MTSGLPVNLTYSPAATFQVSGAPTYRPNVTGDIYGDGSDRQLLQPRQRRGSDRSASRSATRRATSRAARRSTTLDLGLHKSFGLGLGDSRLEFRIEAFNVLNRTNFGAPNGNRSSTDFGTIPTLSTPPRQIQLGVKVDF